MDPNTPQYRLQNQEQLTEQQNQQAAAHTTRQPGQEFESVEALLRFDAAQTTPPDRILERLEDSLAKNPLPSTAWWRRFWPW